MDGSAESLSGHLETLKQRGTALLLLSHPSVRPDCSDLLGSDTERRRRLFVTTDGRSAAEPFPGAPEPATAAHVTVGSETTRAAAAATVGPSVRGDDARDSSGAWHTHVEDSTDLASVASAVHGQIGRFERYDPSPGELRLCFDSLNPLVDRLDERELFRFLHVVTHRVRAADGLGHFHLTVDADERLTRTLAPLFEAVVEQRRTPAGLANRWRFRDVDVETDWILVE